MPPGGKEPLECQVKPVPSGCNLFRLAFHFSLDGYIRSKYIHPHQIHALHKFSHLGCFTPAARSVKPCDWVSFSPVSKSTLSAYACGALKPTNVCAPFPGRGENLEWKLLKQRRKSSRGPDCLVLKSSYGGRRRNMKSHSAQGKGRVPDERGHEKTAEMSIGRSGV